MLFQFAQTFLRLVAKAFPKLVPLVKEPCVARIRFKRAVIRRPRTRRLSEYVEVSNAEVAPHDRKMSVQLRAPFPQLNRLPMPPPVIKQITQIIRRAAVSR